MKPEPPWKHDWTQGPQVSVCRCAFVRRRETKKATQTRREGRNPPNATLHTHDNAKSGDDTKEGEPQSPTREAKYEAKRYMSESNTELENHISRKWAKWLKPSRCVFCFPTVSPGYKKNEKCRLHWGVNGSVLQMQATVRAEILCYYHHYYCYKSHNCVDWPSRLPSTSHKRLHAVVSGETVVEPEHPASKSNMCPVQVWIQFYCEIIFGSLKCYTINFRLFLPLRLLV